MEKTKQKDEDKYVFIPGSVDKPGRWVTRKQLNGFKKHRAYRARALRKKKISKEEAANLLGFDKRTAAKVFG